jgi:hypothetical protein
VLLDGVCSPTNIYPAPAFWKLASPLRFSGSPRRLRSWPTTLSSPSSRTSSLSSPAAGDSDGLLAARAPKVAVLGRYGAAWMSPTGRRRCALPSTLPSLCRSAWLGRNPRCSLVLLTPPHQLQVPLDGVVIGKEQPQHLPFPLIFGFWFYLFDFFLCWLGFLDFSLLWPVMKIPDPIDQRYQLMFIFL